MRVVRIVAMGVSIALGTTSCSSPGRGPRAERHTGASTTSSSSGAASSTTAAGGVRTVLSPIGLNIRSQPSSSASVVRTAAQGAVLTVLAHTDQGGGW
ncbi:MAG TPA: SH3 domain-containing protein, partial [Acidimicrobiales bacterium]|nr:SH3 domain-containing protein [Acidimicrobiales bacterium]